MYIAGDYWFIRGRNCFVLHDSAEQARHAEKTAGWDTTNVSVTVLHNVYGKKTLTRRSACENVSLFNFSIQCRVKRKFEGLFLRPRSLYLVTSRFLLYCWFFISLCNWQLLYFGGIKPCNGSSHWWSGRQRSWIIDQKLRREYINFFQTNKKVNKWESRVQSYLSLLNYKLISL